MRSSNVTSLKIQTRVVLGFAFIIGLSALSSSWLVLSLNGLRGGIESYRELSAEADLMRDLGENAAHLVATVRSYLQTRSEADYAAASQQREAIQGTLAKADAIVHDAGRRALLARIGEATERFESAVERSFQLQIERDTLMRLELDPVTMKLRQAFGLQVTVLEKLYDDVRVAHFSQLSESMLVSRLALARLVETADPLDWEEAQAALDRLDRIYSKFLQDEMGLARIASVPGLAERIDFMTTAISPAILDLRRAAQRLNATLAAQDALRKTELDPSVEQIKTFAAQLRASAGQDQAALLAGTEQTTARAFVGSLASLAALTILGFGLAWLVGRSIVGPVLAMTGAMRRIAGGEHALPVPHLDRRDEVGEMARAVAVFRDNAVQRTRLEDEQTLSAQERGRRVASLEGAIAGFDAKAMRMLDDVRGAADNLDAVADRLDGAARSGAGEANEAGLAVQTSLESVTLVAAAAEELEASIRDIASQSEQSSSVAGAAELRAREATVGMETLAGTADHIGRVTDVIRAIAGQTNLLALNAHDRGGACGRCRARLRGGRRRG